MNPAKRRKTDTGILLTPVRQPKNPLVGPAFMQAIDNINSPLSGDVYTHVSVPMKYSPGRKAHPLNLHATFYAIDHNSATNTTSEAGFRDKMRTAFPQLLTGTTNPVGGASHYNTIIHNQLTATPGNSVMQQSLRRKVVEEAHAEVNRESRNRFNHKWAQIEGGHMTTDQAGAWWVARFGAGVGGPNSLSGTGMKKRAIRRAYVSTKLGRHGITHFR